MKCNVMKTNNKIEQPTTNNDFQSSCHVGLLSRCEVGKVDAISADDLFSLSRFFFSCSQSQSIFRISFSYPFHISLCLSLQISLTSFEFFFHSFAHSHKDTCSFSFPHSITLSYGFPYESSEIRVYVHKSK